jgi:hypothetical protein
VAAEDRAVETSTTPSSAAESFFIRVRFEMANIRSLLVGRVKVAISFSAIAGQHVCPTSRRASLLLRRSLWFARQ